MKTHDLKVGDIVAYGHKDHTDIYNQLAIVRWISEDKSRYALVFSDSVTKKIRDQFGRTAPYNSFMNPSNEWYIVAFGSNHLKYIGKSNEKHNEKLFDIISI